MGVVWELGGVMEEHMICGMILQLCACPHHAGTYKVGRGVFESV